MILSRYNLKNIDSRLLEIPADEIFDLPEKVLQFGTGVLLRGLPDYFINKANGQGLFNGRIVMVKSTDRGDTEAYDRQDGLYTLCVRGLENGVKTEENIVNASISRVLSARNDWEDILKCAHNPQMQVIISNTTEVGIQLQKDDVHRHPPQSFPGKLLAFLLERYQAFAGSAQSGLVIVPTELIPDNGRKLESIVLELAHLNGLEDDFISWIEKANYFCNSLVDRIVPGSPDAALKKELESAFGFRDDLLCMTEVYRLWAIEGNDQVREILSFAGADTGVVIEPDITRYRELKLRMLNGTHTFSCGLAWLGGFDTVKDAMDHPAMSQFIEQLMQDDIARAIPYPIEAGLVRTFGRQVLDRFRNPSIEHHWISITMQYTSKMRMRNQPLLMTLAEKGAEIPPAMALGFAAYLLFLRPVARKEDGYYGEWQGREYPIKDDYAPYFYQKWKELSPDELPGAVLSDQQLWTTDLSLLPGFVDQVGYWLSLLISRGVEHALSLLHSKKALA